MSRQRRARSDELHRRPPVGLGPARRRAPRRPGRAPGRVRRVPALRRVGRGAAPRACGSRPWARPRHRRPGAGSAGSRAGSRAHDARAAGDSPAQPSTVAVAAAALVAGVLIGANLVGVGTAGRRPSSPTPCRPGWPPPRRRVEGPAGGAPPDRAGLEPRGARTDLTPARSTTARPSRWPSVAGRHHLPQRRMAAERRDPAHRRQAVVGHRPAPMRLVGPARVLRRSPVSGPWSTARPSPTTRPVPLELIVPVRSFSRVDTARVVGEGEVAGRPTVEVTVVAAQVGPLLAGLAPGGQPPDGPPHRRGPPVARRRAHGPAAPSGSRPRATPTAVAWAAQPGLRRPPRPRRARPAGHQRRPRRPARRPLHAAGQRRRPPTPASGKGPPGSSSTRARPRASRPAGPGASTVPRRPASGRGRDGRAWIRLQATTAWVRAWACSASSGRSCGPGRLGDGRGLRRRRRASGGPARRRASTWWSTGRWAPPSCWRWWRDSAFVPRRCPRTGRSTAPRPGRHPPGRPGRAGAGRRGLRAPRSPGWTATAWSCSPSARATGCCASSRSPAPGSACRWRPTTKPWRSAAMPAATPPGPVASSGWRTGWSSPCRARA